MASCAPVVARYRSCDSYDVVGIEASSNSTGFSFDSTALKLPTLTHNPAGVPVTLSKGLSQGLLLSGGLEMSFGLSSSGIPVPNGVQRSLSLGRLSVTSEAEPVSIGSLSDMFGHDSVPMPTGLTRMSSGARWLDSPRGRSVEFNMPLSPLPRSRSLGTIVSVGGGDYEAEAAPLSSDPPLLPVGLPMAVVARHVSPRTPAAPRKRSRDEYECEGEASVVPPGGAPTTQLSNARPPKAPRRKMSLHKTANAGACAAAGAGAGAASASASARRPRTVTKRKDGRMMLPPPPTFFDPAKPMSAKTFANLEKRVGSLVHGPPNKKLGKYYGAKDWCCERCRNIFKDHTKPFKRPAHDVRSVLRKLRLQACVDVGMRGYATDSSGNSINHNSKITPLASEHECAAGRRTRELLRQIRVEPAAAAAAGVRQ